MLLPVLRTKTTCFCSDEAAVFHLNDLVMFDTVE